MKPVKASWNRFRKTFLYQALLLLLLFPLFPIVVWLYVSKIRLVKVTTPGRIGHLCIEPECFIKEGLLGLRPNFVGVLLAPRRKLANPVVIDLWKRHVPVITSSLLCHLLAPLLEISFLSYSVKHYAVAIDETAACGRIFAQWEDRPALLQPALAATTQGWEALHRLGMPKGSWFVCVHSRDGAYSPSTERLHSYRNCSIENYRLAMQAIVERGGWCVRMGGPTPDAVGSMPGVIDYANSPERSDWMDVFLCANCRFFLGNTSGLCFLSSIFGVPTALANMIPVSCALPVSRGDVGIPKLLRFRTSGRLLSYREVLGSPVGNFRFSSQYEKEGISVEENSPDEIRDLAIEMLDRLSGTATHDAQDEQLQRQFQGLIRPTHYSFGAHSRIGRDFLRKHAGLL